VGVSEIGSTDDEASRSGFEAASRSAGSSRFDSDDDNKRAESGWSAYSANSLVSDLESVVSVFGTTNDVASSRGVTFSGVVMTSSVAGTAAGSISGGWNDGEMDDDDLVRVAVTIDLYEYGDGDETGLTCCRGGIGEEYARAKLVGVLARCTRGDTNDDVADAFSSIELGEGDEARRLDGGRGGNGGRDAEVVEGGGTGDDDVR
jgi:hypothetical protein